MAVTIFDDASLRAEVDSFLASIGDIPAGKRGALVGWYDLSGTYRAQAIYRINDNWIVGGELAKARDQGLAVRVMFRGYL